MNTESIDRRLHRLHDGDLSAEERAALEKEIAADPVLAKKLEGLREVAVVVHAARTEGAGEIDGEALWKAIEAEITAEAPATQAPAASARPALRAIEGGAAPKAAAPAEDVRARRRRYIGVAVGVFAIAAAALLMIYGPPDAPPETVAETTPAPSTTDAVPEVDEQQASASASDYTEVLAVDFGTNVGTIFAVEGEGGQRYAVVWLDDVLKQDEGDAPLDAPTPD
jgi:hypothetical protein